MKKLVSFALSLVMLFGLSVPVHATNLRKVVGFYTIVLSDGANKTVTLNFATDPVGYGAIGTANFLSSVFSALPNDVNTSTLNCALGITSSSYNALTHTLTVTFTNSGSAGDTNVLSGLAEFN